MIPSLLLTVLLWKDEAVDRVTQTNLSSLKNQHPWRRADRSCFFCGACLGDGSIGYRGVMLCAKCVEWFDYCLLIGLGKCYCGRAKERAA
jgi:hypothetical protein